MYGGNGSRSPSVDSTCGYAERSRFGTNQNVLQISVQRDSGSFYNCKYHHNVDEKKKKKKKQFLQFHVVFNFHEMIQLSIYCLYIELMLRRVCRVFERISEW